MLILPTDAILFFFNRSCSHGTRRPKIHSETVRPTRFGNFSGTRPDKLRNHRRTIKRIRILQCRVRPAAQNEFKLERKFAHENTDQTPRNTFALYTLPPKTSLFCSQKSSLRVDTTREPEDSQRTMHPYSPPAFVLLSPRSPIAILDPLLTELPSMFSLHISTKPRAQSPCPTAPQLYSCPASHCRLPEIRILPETPPHSPSAISP